MNPTLPDYKKLFWPIWIAIFLPLNKFQRPSTNLPLALAMALDLQTLIWFREL